MTLEIVVPELNTKDKSVKDLVFTILSEDSPKTLTQLHREVKRRYGVSVTFQAILKAVRSLHAHHVLQKEGKLYGLNKEWIFETRKFLDRLYTEHFKVAKPMKKIELGKDITVYTVSNLLELDRLWNDILTNWAKIPEKEKINAWRGRHGWWLIPRLQEEDLLHDFMIKNKVKTYNLFLKNTPLDKVARNYYSMKGEESRISRSQDSEKDIHLASFGEFILKFEIPAQLSSKLEAIYTKTKRLEYLDVKKAIDTFKLNSPIEVTVMKDALLAGKIQEDIREEVLFGKS